MYIKYSLCQSQIGVAKNSSGNPGKFTGSLHLRMRKGRKESILGVQMGRADPPA